MSLTQKQERFVQEYLVDGNGTRAATVAGYSAKTATEQGSRLVRNVHVKAALDAARTEITKRSELSIAKVDSLHASVIDFHARTMDVTFKDLYDDQGNLRPVHELEDHVAAALGSMEIEEIEDEDGVVQGRTRKTKLADPGKSAATRAAELAYRRLGALRDHDKYRVDFGGLTIIIFD